MTSSLPPAVPDLRERGLVLGDDGRVRCFWSSDGPGMAPYHDDEWGLPVADDHRLFEKICLEGFQSGLSWRTVLDKRPAFREVFHGFDPERVAGMGEADVVRLLGDARIIRHRGKIEATLNNAARACEAIEVHGSLAALLWRYEPDPAARPEVVTKAWICSAGPAPEAVRLAKDLKKLGWRFFGPTTAYAFMQSMGMVNDHVDGCCARGPCEQARAGFVRPA